MFLQMSAAVVMTTQRDKSLLIQLKVNKKIDAIIKVGVRLCCDFVHKLCEHWKVLFKIECILYIGQTVSEKNEM